MLHTPIAKIISWNIDNEAVCASAAKMSTTKGNANEIFEQAKNNPHNTALIQKVLCSGHKSVIEHAVFSIAFWDVSAYVEQFLIECRLASFTVKSRRYVDFSNLGYFIPPNLAGENKLLYCKYMNLLFNGYKSLLEASIPKEDARFLLPYSFCSNFYCTLNARELGNLISSIMHGRGRNIPELKNLAQQLIIQIADVFPALLPELEDVSDNSHDAYYKVPFACDDSISFVNAEEAGHVCLLQAPSSPKEILKLAFSFAHSGLNKTFNIEEILTSTRPRELEQLSYTFSISNITLSGITHLVRHRMQSAIIPPIQNVNHSRFIIPSSLEQNDGAKASYISTIAKAQDILTQAQKNDILREYGYYFALSGNVMDVMTTMNARELMLFIRLRACNRAQWEIRKIAIEMLTLLQKSFPELFKQYGPTCVLSGICPEGKLSCGKMESVIGKFKKHS